MTLRRSIGFVGLGLILALANWDVLQKRSLIDNGRLLLLELQPIDPLSLIQSGYMALTLAEGTMPDSRTIEALPYRGSVILDQDANGVGRYARLDDGSPFAAGELRVQYRRHEDWRGPRLDYGAQFYFFQEGHAELYGTARYAVLRVAPDGEAILTDLADEDGATIRPHP